MEKEISVLIVDAFETDAELLRRELRKANISFTSRRVETKDAFLKELGASKPDIILSDSVMPKFDGSSVLAIARKQCPEVPVVFVTASMGEPLAVEALKAGAADYVLKDRLAQLGPAVRSALRAAQERAKAKRLEEQLRQTQKMEVVGRLAGGVAHDFNNLLTAISGYSELLLGNLAPGDPNRADVEEIKKTVYRAAALTRQLLSFSRKQTLRPVVLDLNAVVANVEKMLQRLIGEDIHFTTRIDPKAGRIVADAGQIEQVIMNLTVNSRDAMPQGGKLIVETGNVELDEHYAATHVDVKPGRYVMLAVSDTGCGMSREIMDKIFEPFFTTKEKGTGLGLSTVYGIARQFGAHVSVYSEEGKGTTFKVYFPPVEDALIASGEKSVRLGDLRGKEAILFVDDEDAVRKLARRVLEQNGYQVLDARNGAEALRTAKEHASEIHVLATDMIMYGLSGPELARRLLAERPQMKVLYLSGYTDEMIRNHMTSEGAAISFLPKPFTPNDLLRRIRETLDSAKPAGDILPTRREIMEGGAQGSLRNK